MADKKYYWLKMQDDFFDQKEIKALRHVAGGDTFTIIYLKMMLKSLNNNGILYYEGIGKDFADEVAIDIDEGTDNVRVTINFLRSKGLLFTGSEDEYELSKVKTLTGSETPQAERMRRLREKRHLSSMCKRKNVTLLPASDTDIDIDKELDIEIENPLSGKPDDTYQSLTEKEVIQAFNQITGKHLSETASGNKSLIKPRLKGHSLEDFQHVFKNAVRAWQGSPKMERYIQLSTLMQKAKFDERIDHMAEAFDKPIKKETLINYNEDPPKVNLNDIDPDLRELL
ncbi:phage replisome organizer N-terminal domain-containing protein [Oenococcus oeni]|uniref:phage replisome organizer N-terminal domain-containing protein n=1 Tax=Oenococcus oeni TaxID=1247 RepID=UPI00067B480F|nr:phage replisome organizer N-terminal domain-containing protein [Oenococcus oeni]